MLLLLVIAVTIVAAVFTMLNDELGPATTITSDDLGTVAESLSLGLRQARCLGAQGRRATTLGWRERAQRRSDSVVPDYPWADLAPRSTWSVERWPLMLEVVEVEEALGDERDNDQH